MNYDNLLVCLKENLTPEIHADVENLIDRLEHEKTIYRDQLLETRHDLVKIGQENENQKYALDATKEILESYQRQINAMKVLLKEEWV